MTAITETALIVGGGPGTSASCAALFAQQGMTVAVAARTPDKQVLKDLEVTHGIKRYGCDAADPASVAALFESIESDLSAPRLVVHNIDGRMSGVFRKGIDEVDPDLVRQVLHNSAYSAFLVSQEAAKCMLNNETDDKGKRGTIIFTNASGAMKGFAKSGAFAMACHAKKGLAQSIARELNPKGIHVAHVPIDGGIGRIQEDGTRGHWAGGEIVDDNMVHPEHIAETYLQLHRQHRSTWAFEVILRPWTENW